MIFDDHDLHDDWNISWSWVQDMRELDWWDERIAGASCPTGPTSTSATSLRTSCTRTRCTTRSAPARTARSSLRPFAIRADREAAGTRWSFSRDYGGVRVIVLDSRAGRVLRDKRSMFDEDEWDWICERLVGGHDHLVVATSLPLLLGPGVHYLRRGTRPSATAPGGAPGRGSARRSAAGSTSSTGPRSASRSTG
jgi:hypothetical protein